MNQKLHKEYPGLEVCGLGYSEWLEDELVQARAGQAPLPFSEPHGNPPDADQPPDHPCPAAGQAQAGVNWCKVKACIFTSSFCGRVECKNTGDCDYKLSAPAPMDAGKPCIEPVSYIRSRLQEHVKEICGRDKCLIDEGCDDCK